MDNCIRIGKALTTATAPEASNSSFDIRVKYDTFTAT